MNKTRLYMAVILVIVSFAYFMILDTLVLGEVHQHWMDLKFTDMLWSIAPSVLLLINAVVLLVCKDSSTIVESKYCGTKYAWMGHISVK